MITLVTLDRAVCERERSRYIETTAKVKRASCLRVFCVLVGRPNNPRGLLPSPLPLLPPIPSFEGFLLRLLSAGHASALGTILVFVERLGCSLEILTLLLEVGEAGIVILVELEPIR